MTKAHTQAELEEEIARSEAFYQKQIIEQLGDVPRSFDLPGSIDPRPSSALICGCVLAFLVAIAVIFFAVDRPDRRPARRRSA